LFYLFRVRGEILEDELESIEDLNELKRECRVRFLILLKGVYWEEFEKGNIKGVDVLKLIETAETSQDEFDNELNDWKDILHDIKPSLYSRFVFSLGRISAFRNITQQYFLRDICSYYDIATTFINSHEITLDRLKEVIN
jgi:hypothetical protein